MTLKAGHMMSLVVVALGGEAVYGALRFHGGWSYAYGAVAGAAFVIAAAMWRITSR